MLKAGRPIAGGVPNGRSANARDHRRRKILWLAVAILFGLAALAEWGWHVFGPQTHTFNIVDQWGFYGNQLCCLVRVERCQSVVFGPRFPLGPNGWKVLDRRYFLLRYPLSTAGSGSLGPPIAKQVYVSANGVDFEGERASFLDGCSPLQSDIAIRFGVSVQTVDTTTGTISRLATLSMQQQKLLGYPTNLLKTRSGRYGLTDQNGLTILDITTGKTVPAGQALVALLSAHRDQFEKPLERFFLTDDLRFAVCVPFDPHAARARLPTKTIIADAANGTITEFAVTRPAPATVHAVESINGQLWLLCGGEVTPSFVTDRNQSQRFDLAPTSMQFDWSWDPIGRRFASVTAPGSGDVVGFPERLTLTDYRLGTTASLALDRNIALQAIRSAHR